MSENPISISNLNDFIFCPVSIYFHALENEENILSQDTAQINGSYSHRNSDNAVHSTKKNVLQGISVLGELIGYEGPASKVYFKNHFNNIPWFGRQPRIKKDYINSVLDIGYTLLFTYIDALLSSFGFDTYCGVMHREFYMRKSLVCDLVEPFRTLIDHEVKKAVNLRQIQENDFAVINHQFRLKWSETEKYVRILMKPLIENKESIFCYIQAYYRAFMKDSPIELFPDFHAEEIE